MPATWEGRVFPLPPRMFGPHAEVNFDVMSVGLNTPPLPFFGFGKVDVAVRRYSKASFAYIRGLYLSLKA